MEFSLQCTLGGTQGFSTVYIFSRGVEPTVYLSSDSLNAQCMLPGMYILTHLGGEVEWGVIEGNTTKFK